MSVLPTNHGQSVVMRLLDPDNIKIGIRQLGLGDGFDYLRELIKTSERHYSRNWSHRSGKTTTLYAALNADEPSDRKIITAEDPVEYYLPGINQTEVRHDIGLDFAKIIKAMLRQAQI